MYCKHDVDVPHVLLSCCQRYGISLLNYICHCISTSIIHITYRYAHFTELLLSAECIVYPFF